MTTILSFKDLMGILFYNVQRVIYKFYQFLSFDRIHYIVSKNSSCQTLTNHLDGYNFVTNGAILAWVRGKRKCVLHRA